MPSYAFKLAFYGAALLALLALIACGESESSSGDCGGACSADQRCVEGKCISSQLGDMAVVPPDAGPDQGRFIDTMPPSVMDATVIPDQRVRLDAAVQPDATSTVDMVIPDMVVDAACAPTGDEVCDELDNDCDGQVDEGDLPPNGECETGFPGICAIGQYVCNDGVRTCESPLPFAADACDTLDNDCDGSVDEDGPTVGDPCDTGDPGICQLGRNACNEDGAYICAAQFEAVEETCDGRDNDCDGNSDESDALIGTECDSGELGACALGQQLCQNGALHCVAVAQATDEVCNNVDDNCNGAIDEELPVEFQACVTERLGACRDGQRVCDAGAMICIPQEPPRAERCDGFDDDCDGGIDEDYRDLFLDCTVGVGTCERTGQLVCAADGDGTACSALAGDPAPEICDGLDNDCDGGQRQLSRAAPRAESLRCLRSGLPIPQRLRSLPRLHLRDGQLYAGLSQYGRRSRERLRMGLRTHRPARRGL
jgi:hypothetical protein